ncbi:cell division protein FtsZ [Oceanivirga salmonicida]|uniref:cell division protein FtsZ n=1 Tax=Oceanivirga salmonicida TaxID=1769291 RepID=UPI00082D93CE|nr:cell division protein FtsZ [Oceanivirga salmonicida]
MFDNNIQDIETKGTKIKIVGVGGAGANVLNDLINHGIKDVTYFAINTDEQDLRKSKADEKMALGHLGAGANPEVAKVAAEGKKREIEDSIKGQDMIFITAGMGGGTGTGAAPVVAQVAKELDIVTVAIVTRPFSFEGIKRKNNANYGIEELKKYVDTLIVIPNNKLLELSKENKSFPEHLKNSNEIIRFGIKGISELITKQGYINLDFADVEAIVKGSGIALFGFGESEAGEPVESLVERTISNPLLERDIKGATKILVNVTGGDTLTMEGVQKILEMISERASGSKDGVENLILGSIYESDRENVVLSVIATGFEENAENLEGLSSDLYGGKIFEEEKKDFDIVPKF